MTRAQETATSTPVLAGIVTALVGYTSSFAVVLAGLRAVGASQAQATSGLITVTVVFAILMIGLAWRTKVPVTLAWSTPGAALLVGTGVVDGGWPAAVGAFIVTGILLALTGVIKPLARAIAAIPVHIAQAMLAGILLSLCLAPFTALSQTPAIVGPVILVWLAATAWWSRWAVPLALTVAIAGIGIWLWHTGGHLASHALVPRIEWTTPTFTVAAIIGIAIPLTVVTMASQNIAGAAVLQSFGYRTPWTPAMIGTGLGTALSAPFGGYAINLAALSAALAAGEEAGPKERRWIAAVTAGFGYLLLAGFTGLLVALASAAPTGVIEAVAGLALLGTFALAARSALDDARHRISAVVTFLVAGSGLQWFGVSGAFWALVLGIGIHLTLERSQRGKEQP